ncbi:MAG TPA: BON domain-containing protein [Gaiellaceae bacterium]|nr:BON domain-containing protein [Gaiellaceae bacterium]
MTRLRYAALGAALAYFFDPQNGRARRRDTIKRIVQLSQRQRGRLTARAQPDDVTLARQVESEIFGDADVPKGQINVNAEEGKVVLRGEVESVEMIEELVSKARKVQGVQEVENLLHTPGQAAPMHQ